MPALESVFSIIDMGLREAFAEPACDELSD
jgi:hypothetical protein